MVIKKFSLMLSLGLMGLAFFYLALLAYGEEMKPSTPPSDLAEDQAAAEAAAVLYRPTQKSFTDFGKEKQILRVLVQYSRTNFFVSKGIPMGLEYEALLEYERFLNSKKSRARSPKMRIIFIPVRFDQLIPFLLAGKGDIAAGLLTVTPERQKMVSFTNPYIRDVQEVLVAYKTAKLPRTIEELSGRTVHVLHSSSFVEHLRELNQGLEKKNLPPVKIVEMPSSTNIEDILEMVNAGIFELTVSDDFVADLWVQILPDIRVLKEVPLSRGGNLGWAVRQDNPELLKSLNAFIGWGREHLQQKAAVILKRYYKDTKLIKNPISLDNMIKNKEVSTYFQEAGRKNKFDWLMMMAQGFQESGLNQNKRSPQGAIGIMQLLPSTAKEVGYKNIKKEKPNILAGVAYMNFIRRNYFNEPKISLDARVDFTLAAYNAGPNRIQGLRELARKRGLNPNVWFGHVEKVALDKVGEEPVRYVSNINRYYLAYKLSREFEEAKRAKANK